MEAIDEILVDFRPINFYKEIAYLLLKVIFFFVGGWLLFFVTSDEEGSVYLKTHIGFTLICFSLFLLIAVIQTWVYGKVYIYKLIVKDELINIKWQEWKAFKEITVSTKMVNANLVPSGKDNPYMQLDIIDGNRVIKLKQSLSPPEWNRKFMENIILKISNAKNGDV